MTVKTSIDQVKFTRFTDLDGAIHFAADWDNQPVRYTRQLNKEVKKTLKDMAIKEFGFYSGITGSSVYISQA